MTMKSKVVFTLITPSEIRFNYRGGKFLLQEGKIGVYGIGCCVRLYELRRTERNFISVVGWTCSDNHSGPRGAVLPGIVTIEQCKEAAIIYIDNLLN